MRRILRWLKNAWLYVFADVRTEMRKPGTHEDTGEREDGGEPE